MADGRTTAGAPTYRGRTIICAPASEQERGLLDTRVGSRPAKRRPVLVISAATYNQRKPATVVALVITSNKTDLAERAGDAPLALMREIDRGLRNSLGL